MMKIRRSPSSIAKQVDLTDFLSIKQASRAPYFTNTKKISTKVNIKQDNDLSFFNSLKNGKPDVTKF